MWRLIGVKQLFVWLLFKRSFCGQPHYCNKPYYLAARFWHTSLHMVSAKSLLDRPMSCKRTQNRPCQISCLWTWPMSDQRQNVSINKIWKWSAITPPGWKTMHTWDYSHYSTCFHVLCINSLITTNNHFTALWSGITQVSRCSHKGQTYRTWTTTGFLWTRRTSCRSTYSVKALQENPVVW